MTFSLTIKDAAEVAAAASAERLAAAKAECRRRILAVADETAQLNMTAAAAAGLLAQADRTTFAAALAWVAAMRAACATAAQAADPAEDVLWPAVPAGVAELAARF